MVFIKFIHSKKLTIGRLTKMDISYQIHARDLGWLPQISNGQPAGILGATVIEAITISANGLPQGVSLRYRVYSADVGWGEWQRSGGVAGTTQKGLQAENIQIELVGAKDNLGAIYECAVGDKGWLPYVQNGQSAGTEGMGLGIEVIKATSKNLSTIGLTR